MTKLFNVCFLNAIRFGGIGHLDLPRTVEVSSMTLETEMDSEESGLGTRWTRSSDEDRIAPRLLRVLWIGKMMEDDWAIGLRCILEYFRFGKKKHVGMGHTYPHWAVLY